MSKMVTMYIKDHEKFDKARDEALNQYYRTKGKMPTKSEIIELALETLIAELSALPTRERKASL